MLKFNYFKTLLHELKLREEILPILLSNGFDEWETLTELTDILLIELGLFLHNYLKFYLYYKKESIIQLKSKKSSVV